MRKWLADRRARFFDGKICALCGAKENLCIHHRVTSEKVSNNVFSWTKERMELELAKCTVLCESCHNLYHAEKKRKPFEHGTMNAYWTKNCRCPECRAANAKYKREQKLRLRLAHATASD